ncbi:hypothetical protein EDC90_1001136 [Martelella mediterranea]|uniref:Uncharacterized protein n=1 Tax=Martelella mediterranea TaxID=293089 RepID=A0A4R3NXL7_9HYPH|nr:hypothetical protein EDC90_1001136 [Martelella mediterranea]
MPNSRAYRTQLMQLVPNFSLVHRSSCSPLEVLRSLLTLKGPDFSVALFFYPAQIELFFRIKR